MFSMRIDGYTLQEIADKFGITKERVRQIVLSPGHVQFRQSRDWKYPAIVEWIKSNGLTKTQFSELTGISQANISSILAGKHEPRKSSIDNILKATGMTYEEAFANPENKNPR